LEEQEIEREKGVILEEINTYLDMPRIYVGELWDRLLYGDQPAGWMLAGEKETIKSLKRPQFIKYLQSQYVAKNTIVLVAGNKEAVNVSKQKIQKYFSAVKTSNFKNKQKVLEKQAKPNLLVHFKETDQTHLIVGCRGYDIFHKDRYAAGLLATILGGNGGLYMSSRLWIEVRERRGLAYYVSSSSDNYTDTGYFAANAGVDNKRIEDAIEVILTELDKVKEQKIPEKEIQKAKDHIRGATLLSLESSDEVASYLGGQEVLKKEILLPEQFFKKIEKITSADLQRVAREIFQPSKLNLALIGPFKEKERFEKLLKI
jgi:predicted Zn-dependent peptidase